MSKKQHDTDNIDLVRKILDNPQHTLPNSKDVYIDTLRRRLMNQSRNHYQVYPSSSSSDSSLTPQVTIHHTPQNQEQFTKDQPQEGVPQENQVSDVDQQFFFPNEDLFEIEQVKKDEVPDFIEVKPKNQISIPKIEQTISPHEKEPETPPLPKWELVEDQEIVPETDDEVQEEEITEEPVFKTIKESKEQKPMIWEPVDQQKIPEKSKEKKPLFKKFSRKKPTFESVNEKEPKFHVNELKTSIKKLQEKTTDSPFHYKGYTLYQKQMDLGNNKKRVIHFFSKDEPEDSTPSPLPKDYEVRVNKKNGVPYIRKKET
jgi:hypothetical protein